MSAESPAAAIPPRVSDTTFLARLLEEVAHRVAEHGTAAEPRAIWAIAGATRELSPGAVEALLDSEGAEVARQRAFGVLHGVVLHELTPDQRSWLLDDLQGTLRCAVA